MAATTTALASDCQCYDLGHSARLAITMDPDCANFTVMAVVRITNGDSIMAATMDESKAPRCIDRINRKIARHPTSITGHTRLSAIVGMANHRWFGGHRMAPSY